MNGLFGYTARDVDCAFKRFRRSVWHSTTVASRGATFSAELVIKARRLGFSVVSTGQSLTAAGRISDWSPPRSDRASDH